MAPVRPTLLALLALAGCASSPTLFANRKPIAPLRERLAASGGDPSRIVTLRAATDLATLIPNERYKFALTAEGAFRVAPLPASAANNEYVHPILADGAPVRTAGMITVAPDGAVTLDRDSRAYCPTEASLAQAVDALVAMGVPRARVRTAPVEPRCEPPLR